MYITVAGYNPQKAPAILSSEDALKAKEHSVFLKAE